MKVMKYKMLRVGEASNSGGIKVKVLGDNSSDFKFKIKNRK